MVVTDDVSKFDKSIDVKDIQSVNISPISTTDEVSTDLNFMDFKFLQPENM